MYNILRWCTWYTSTRFRNAFNVFRYMCTHGHDYIRLPNTPALYNILIRMCVVLYRYIYTYQLIRNNRKDPYLIIIRDRTKFEIIGCNSRFYIYVYVVVITFQFNYIYITCIITQRAARTTIGNELFRSVDCRRWHLYFESVV